MADTFLSNMANADDAIFNALGERVSVDHEIFIAVVSFGIEVIDPESGMSYYGDIVEVPRNKLLSHVHGTVMTVIETNKDYKLQKTIKDDGLIRTIEITR